MKRVAKRRPRKAAREARRPPIDLSALVEAAKAARARAYAPYSNYLVGAALLTKSGSIYTGCNVENATYGATICAERTCIVKMVAAGERDPIACVVVTGGAEAGTPCGICRQVLAEFADDMLVVLVSEGASRARARRETTLAKLLPQAFGPGHLGGKKRSGASTRRTEARR